MQTNQFICLVAFDGYWSYVQSLAVTNRAVRSNHIHMLNRRMSWFLLSRCMRTACLDYRVDVWKAFSPRGNVSFPQKC